MNGGPDNRLFGSHLSLLGFTDENKGENHTDSED